MTDIVNTLRGGFCEPNTGCMVLKTCVCDVLDDAADEIERLRQDNRDMRQWLLSLEAAGARMSRVWKRAEVIHREMTEKQGSGND